MSWHYGPLLPGTASAGLADLDAVLSITDSADSFSAVAGVDVVALFSKTDSADTFSSTATVGIDASLTRTDSTDPLSSTGTMGDITATFSKTDTADTLVFDAINGSSLGGLVFRAGVGRNFGGMFFFEPGTGTNEVGSNPTSAIPVRFGRFGGGMYMVTAPAPTNPGPGTTTVVALPSDVGIGFGGSNTANSTRVGTFSMLAGVGNLSTIDTTDRIADQGVFGIGFGWSNTGKGAFTSSAASAFGMGGTNAIAVPSTNSYSTGQSDAGFGVGGSNDNLFIVSSTYSDADVQIGGENTVIATTAEYAAIQLALSALPIEGAESLRDVLRLIRAATVGKGVHGAQIEYLSADGSKARIVADLTGGNRDVISTDPS